MRTWMISIGLTLVSATGAVATEPRDKVCELIGSLAEVTMHARQLGEPMSSLMQMDNTQTGRALTVRAYEYPAFHSPEARQRAIREFRIDAERECYKQLKE